jgi:hypothetical protein
MNKNEKFFPEGAAQFQISTIKISGSIRVSQRSSPMVSGGAAFPSYLPLFFIYTPKPWISTAARVQLQFPLLTYLLPFSAFTPI